MTGIKRLSPSTGGNAPQRFRVGISDGEHWISVMLASQLNQLVAEERIMENTVLRINEALVQPVNGRPCASALLNAARVVLAREAHSMRLTPARA